MYFETGQGSAVSAHHGYDQQSLEAHAYAVAHHFKPLLVNTVVGLIGSEYLFNGKQITRAGLEDIMLNDQSTSFHDALVLRQLLGLRAAPEFEIWQHAMSITTAGGCRLPLRPRWGL